MSYVPENIAFLLIPPRIEHLSGVRHQWIVRCISTQRKSMLYTTVWHPSPTWRIPLPAFQFSAINIFSWIVYVTKQSCQHLPESPPYWRLLNWSYMLFVSENKGLKSLWVQPFKSTVNPCAFPQMTKVRNWRGLGLNKLTAIARLCFKFSRNGHSLCSPKLTTGEPKLMPVIQTQDPGTKA